MRHSLVEDVRQHILSIKKNKNKDRAALMCKKPFQSQPKSKLTSPHSSAANNKGIVLLWEGVQNTSLSKAVLSTRHNGTCWFLERTVSAATHLWHKISNSKLLWYEIFLDLSSPFQSLHTLVLGGRINHKTLRDGLENYYNTILLYALRLLCLYPAHSWHVLKSTQY